MSLLLVGSVNAHVGFRDGMDILQSGGSAIDAVVAAIRKVEANPDDHSVGFGGLPNLEGEVELDASIMDGRTLATGAVAALHGYQDAIALARVVMDELPHVLVVGAGADRLASEAGFQRQDLLTPEARVIWESPFTEARTADAYRERMRELAGRLSRDPERPHDAHGTVNVIARDAAGNLAGGVSTSDGPGSSPGGLATLPSSGLATTSTTVGARQHAPVAVKWHSAAAPHTAW
jgi:L-asparaginase / beta-aspartyl-peptidase